AAIRIMGEERLDLDLHQPQIVHRYVLRGSDGVCSPPGGMHRVFPARHSAGAARSVSSASVLG
ncbi:MAG: hypothetical protein WDA75_04015, partial [Candidatus Latescibacterota bacterium]